MKRILVILALSFPILAHIRMPPPTQSEIERMKEIPHLSTEELLKCISENNYYISRSGARELGKRKDTTAVLELRKMLLESLGLESRWTKFFSLVALCLIEDPSALDAIESEGQNALQLMLHELYPSPDDLELIQEVYHGYSEMVVRSSPDPLRAIITRFATRPEWVEKRLVSFGEKAVDPLVQIATSSPSLGRRLSAINALGKIGGKKALETLFSIARGNLQPVPRSRKLFRTSVGAIGETRIKDAVPELIKLFALNRAWTERIAILEALARIASEEALDFCTKLTASDDLLSSTLPRSREEKVRAYSALYQARILIERARDKEETCLKLLHHPHPWARCASAQELVSIATPRSLSALITALDDDCDDVRKFIIQALARLGSPEAVRTLIQILRDEQSPLRLEAKDALTQIGVKLVWTGSNYDICELNLVSSMFSSTDPEERKRASELVVFLGDYACKLMDEALESSVKERRQTARLALQSLAEKLARADTALSNLSSRLLSCLEEGIPYLLSGLAYPNRSVREICLSALASSDLLTNDELTGLLQETDSPLRAQGLARILALRQPDRLKSLLSSKNKIVRTAALKALSTEANPDTDLIQALIRIIATGDLGEKELAYGHLKATPDRRDAINKALSFFSAPDARASLLILTAQGATGMVQIRSALKAELSPDTKLFILHRAGERGLAVPISILFSEDPNLKVAQRALRMMRRLGLELLLSYLQLEAPETESLNRFLTKDDLVVASASALALARSQARDACEPIKAQFLSRPLKLPFLVALEVLGWRDVEVKTLVSSELVIRRLEGARAVGLGFGTPCSALPLLKDEAPEVRYWACWALGQRRFKPALDPLKSLLEDPDSGVRLSAQNALSLIGPGN